MQWSKTCFLVAALLVFLSFGCTDKNYNSDLETHNVSSKDSALDVESSPEEVESSIQDPCEEITSPNSLAWCDCFPECCKSQLWFCPPELGQPAYYKKDVIVDICDDNMIPCTYGVDKDCPPPEIIYMGECVEAYECPPGSQNLDYGWQWCELPDGGVGKQHVTCDKGQLFYTDCQPCDPEVCDGIDNNCDGLVDEGISVSGCETECGPGNAVCVGGEELCFGPEPQEEVCDYLDNDCDGEVDEFQKNKCNECGPVPEEICDGWDNDCDDAVDEDLVLACTTACGSGVSMCISGTWSSCTAPQPSFEICDGLDNDCNGQVDDGIECVCTIQDVGALFPCAESPLICGQGFKTCECIDPGCQEIVTTECYAPCHWLADPPGSDILCDPLVGMALQEEECNNFDDNCNLLIDEDLIAECYTGPEGTLGVGICLPGWMTCVEGAWGATDNQNNFSPGLCIDEVTPQEESCNGIDDDCDGLVDWGEEIPDTDILFIVDWSGSMSDEISAVLASLNKFAANYADQGTIQWGLVVGPISTTGYDERLQMISDVAPFQDFLLSFSGIVSAGLGGGNEMLLDAIYLSLKNISSNAPIDMTTTQWTMGVDESIPPKDQFNISWRPSANRVVIVFSDEKTQSFLKPSTSFINVVDTCKATPQSRIYTFSTQETWMWDEIAQECKGNYYPLSNSTTEMYNYLMEILDEVCMPTPPE